MTAASKKKARTTRYLPEKKARPVFSVGKVVHASTTKGKFVWEWFDYARCGLEAYYNTDCRQAFIRYGQPEPNDMGEYEASCDRPTMDKDQRARSVTCLSCLSTPEEKDA